MIEMLLAWASSLSAIQITIITLGCMVIISLAIWLSTKNFLVALVSLEFIPCFNLAIIITEPWLQLGTKPFLPTWMTLMILILPFIIFPIRLWIIPTSKSNKA